MSQQIKTASDAIDALGGTTAVAVLLGVKLRRVSNWRTRGFPSSVYPTLAPVLRQRKYKFALKLFGRRAALFGQGAERRLSRKVRNGNAGDRRR